MHFVRPKVQFLVIGNCRAGKWDTDCAGDYLSMYGKTPVAVH